MKSIQYRVTRGFSLIEVMIAVVILSFGLLALAALHGVLFRAGAETKARATATALAQEVIEQGRSFAFLTKPDASYTGSTYMDSLVSFGATKVSSGGIEYTLARTVKRYNPATGAEVTGAFSPATPEFKYVSVDVTWTGNDGSSEKVTIKDTVASIAPADAMSVLKTPLELLRGPEVRIEPPNKDNPAVVPIAVGDDKSAASSNPVPRRYEQVDSNTAATLYSIHTFTGSPFGTEVVLNRKTETSDVTCRCSTGAGAGYQSTATNPTYQPTVWNGKQLAYMEPQPLPKGTRIGLFEDKGQSAKDIEAMCDTCCRDHHENAKRTQRPDPSRALTASEANGAEHYFYTDLTKPISSGIYSEACHLIRVGGRMRLAMDPQQNLLVNVPLNSAGTGHEPSNFTTRYSDLIIKYLHDGVNSLPSGYLSPTAGFPVFNEATYAPVCTPGDTACETSSFADIVTPPAPIVLANGGSKTLVAFGLYVDYLSTETRKAYDCALNKATNTGDRSCDGLRDRGELETLPFFSINIANVGVWTLDVNGKDWLTVTSATYDNKGILKGTGGVVKAIKASSAARCDPVTIAITKSSSGVAGRLPIDPDDNKSSNVARDTTRFTGNASVTSCP